ncbi:MAG TPA: IS3 family transposase [Ktedonobacteraceae bacterium]|nr:IS3 family transposase [Ktedonobacteraceae bacterium]
MIRQVHQKHPDLSIVELCELLDVNRSWYYARPEEASEKRADLDLREAIEQVILDFPGYGYRRVTAALRRAGWQVNHKRVQRLMQQESLLCHLKRQFVPTTDSQHPYGIYPNLAKGLEVQAPDVLWVADITYIRLPTSFVYLAAILDAYSRKCIGWKLSRRIDTQLALDALEMACSMRQLRPGLIHHSDRGVQYASAAYVDRLLSLQARISMSAKGNPYDNAKAESFFKTLKYEEVYLNQYQTCEEAEANLAQFIEEVYNTKRLHSSLGYLPPTEFELASTPVGKTSL